jgi:hypothetical protein
VEWYINKDEVVPKLLSASKAPASMRREYNTTKLSLEVVEEFGKNNAPMGWGVKYTGTEDLSGYKHIIYYLGICFLITF